MEGLSISIYNQGFEKTLENSIYNHIMNCGKDYKNITVLCIGTDRSTGDCLAPLVGTYLSKRNKINENFKLLGTLENPVHARNLDDTIHKINKEETLVIAIDASLGKNENIGKINVFKGSLFPGSGVGKNIQPVGDISITGIVNISGSMEYMVLQNTRLSVVTRLSEAIEMCLYNALNRILNFDGLSQTAATNYTY